MTTLVPRFLARMGELRTGQSAGACKGIQADVSDSKRLRSPSRITAQNRAVDHSCWIHRLEKPNHAWELQLKCNVAQFEVGVYQRFPLQAIFLPKGVRDASFSGLRLVRHCYGDGQVDVEPDGTKIH